MPTGTRWQHSPAYATLLNEGSPLYGDLYLAEGQDLVFFALFDH